VTFTGGFFCSPQSLFRFKLENAGRTVKIRPAIFFAAQLASGGVLAEGILVKLAKAAGCSGEVKYPLVDLLNRLA
jgi:hypothetical protein